MIRSSLHSSPLSFLSQKLNWKYIILYFFILLGILRIASVYFVYNPTWDEPYHIGCSLFFYQFDEVRPDDEQPVLSRYLFGLYLHLKGAYLSLMESTMEQSADNLIHTHGNRFTNMALARAPNIFLFILIALLIWIMGKALFGTTAAMVGLMLLASLPPILAHSVLATPDILLVTTFLLSVFMLVRLLDNPSPINAMVFGVSSGLCLLSKYSAGPYLLVTILAIVVLKSILEAKRGSFSRNTLFQGTSLAFIIFLASFLSMWAAYQFSVGPILKPIHTLFRLSGDPTQIDTLSAPLRLMQHSIFPLADYLAGLEKVYTHNLRGHKYFFLEQILTRGNWLFFPVVLLAKTPLPTLILALIGFFYLIKRIVIKRMWQDTVPVVCIISILGIACTSNINIGLRHILPIYPFMLLLCGYAFWIFWEKRTPFKILTRFVLVGLVLWQYLFSFWIHPDYLAFFNLPSYQHRERIIGDSDLDWGQDLSRLVKVIKDKKISRIKIAYNGGIDPFKHYLPQAEELKPDTKVSGWIAVSLHKLQVDKDFAWLIHRTPVMKIGHSINLYYLP